MMTNSILIPLHEYKKETKELLNRSIKSVYEQTKFNFQELKHEVVDKQSIENFYSIYIVTTSAISKKVAKDFPDYKIDFVINKTKNTDIPTQINLGFQEIDSEYITILEYDDMFNNNFLLNVYKYQTTYSDFDGFIPLSMECLADEKSTFVDFYYNVLWSRSVFSTEEREEADIDGTVNLDMIKNSGVNRLSGMTIKKQSFLKANKLKQNIPFAFSYEFLMRFFNEGFKMKLMNKVGYIHTIERPNSYSVKHNLDNYVNNDEFKYWLDIASKEYVFKDESKRPKFKFKA